MMVPQAEAWLGVSAHLHSVFMPARKPTKWPNIDSQPLQHMAY